MQQGEFDFFISRAGADKDVAIHIARILQEAGFITLLQDEDFGPSDFMRQMERGFESGARMVALLSKAYQRSEYCRAEYNHVLSSDPANLNKRLIVLRVEECQPVGSLQTLVYTDLLQVLHDADRFKQAVLLAVGDKPQEMPDWFAVLERSPQQILHKDIRDTANFTGRADELQALEAALWSEGALAAITQSAAVHGLGGVGKSILAKHYGWLHKERYAGVWWLEAEQEGELISGLIALGNKFIPGLAEVQDQLAAVNATFDFLATHYEDAEQNDGGAYKPWLLIYDNVESEAVYRQFAPKGGAQVLLTSRASGFSKAINTVPLNTWPLEEAVAYLGDESGRALGRQEATGLAQTLGCLPLALSHAAAFLRENKAITVASYVENISGWLKKELPKGVDYTEPVFATFQAAIQQCEAQAKGAKAVLAFASFLAADHIPLELYQQDAALYPVDLQPIVAERETMFNALGVLDRLSLIQLDMNSQTFSLHRLVQAVTADDVKDYQQLWLASAIEALVEACPGQDFHDWPAFERLLPHGQQIITKVTDDIEAPLSTLLTQIGFYLHDRATHKETEPLYQRALAIDEKNLGPDHPDVALRLNNLAALLQDTNRMEEAEPLMKRALAIDETSFGLDHPKVAIRLNNLAALLKATNRMEEAEPLMKRALAIDETSFGLDHPKVATRLNNLAALLKATNRMEEAEPLMKRALAIDETSLGPDHPNVALRLNNLAVLLQDTNRMEKAEPLMKRALAIDEASFGPDHPNVAIDLNNLAQLLQDTNRMEEAEPLMKRALAIDETSLGLDHPNVAIDLNNLAALLKATNRMEEAEPLMERALTIDEASLGPDHPNVARDLNNLAQLLLATDRMEEAEPLMKRALTIDETSLGPDHPNVAKDLNNLAMLLKDTNRMEEAEPLYRRALTISEASFGADHPLTNTIRQNLEILLQEKQRLLNMGPPSHTPCPQKPKRGFFARLFWGA